MIGANTSLENAIQELDEKDNSGVLSEDWQRVLRWLYELSNYRTEQERRRELADDDRWS